MNEKIKVIHFLESENLKNCIDLGYLGNENDWNPSGEIMLCPFSRWEELKENGIKFSGQPNLITEGEDTFLRSPDDTSLFIPSNKYKDVVIPTKEGAIIEVLQNLGINEYYIHTLIEGEIGIGGKEETEVKLDATAEGHGGLEGNYHRRRKGGTSVNAEYFKAKMFAFDNKKFVLDEESHQKAEKLANQYGLAKNTEVAEMLRLRKPGTNTLISAYTYLDFTGDITANFDIAKSLKMLAKVPGIASIGGGLSKLFNFEAQAQLKYQTLVIYNFDKEPAVLKKKQQIKELGKGI
jgi:hypothetical protein